MTLFEKALAAKIALADRLDAIDQRIQAMRNSAPMGPMGLTADHIRLSPEFISLCSSYDIERRAFQAFNAQFLKVFKKEYAAYRAARRLQAAA